MVFSKKNDVEVGSASSEKNSVGLGYSDEGAVHGVASHFVAGDGFLAKMHRFGAKMGVETRGIERVPPNERSDTGMSKIGTLVSSSSDALV